MKTINKVTIAKKQLKDWNACEDGAGGKNKEITMLAATIAWINVCGTLGLTLDEALKHLRYNNGLIETAITDYEVKI